jgi:hypothetical protein
MLSAVLERMSPAGRAALVRGLTEFTEAAEAPGTASDPARTA